MESYYLSVMMEFMEMNFRELMRVASAGTWMVKKISAPVLQVVD